MGLNTDWLEILEEHIGYCHERELPAGTRVHAIIEDGHVGLRLITYGAETWEEVGNRARKRTECGKRKYGDHVDTVMVTYDESAHVPPSKRPTQRKRELAELNNKKHPVVPLSDAEVNALVIERGRRIPEPAHEFVRRMFLTRRTHDRLIRFCTAELALCALQPTVHADRTQLVIDGGRPEGIAAVAARAQLGVPFALDQHSSFQCARDGEGMRVFVGALRCADDRAPVPVCTQASTRIGEGDLKIPDLICDLPPNTNVVVRSNDSDMVAVLLLNARRWIDDANGGWVRYGVFIDSEKTGASGAGCIVDVVSLWRCIVEYFARHYPLVDRAVDTMCLLMVLTGTDYAQGFRRLGPRTVWKAFREGGHRIFSETNEHGRCCWLQTHDDVGEARNRYSIAISESALFRFVKLAYQVALRVSDALCPDMDAVRKETQRRDADNCESARYNVTDDDGIRAELRRVWWTLDYWTNGVTSLSYVDPLEMHPHTGLSMHGWQRDHDGEVQCATRVHAPTQVLRQ